MQESDRQAADVQDNPSTQEAAELRRIAHKIAWARMNGSIEAANPFVQTDPNRRTPRNEVNRSSVVR